jgi:DNA-binding transcriptional LysR family regulator
MRREVTRGDPCSTDGQRKVWRSFPSSEANVNIKQLEAFRAVMISGSTVGAAQLLRVSQPAVSRLLGQLEATLQLTLFDRTSGRLAPTTEAALLYDEVERTFASVDKIREIARDIRTANAGELTIASFPLLAMGFLPDAIAQFSELHPRTRVSLSVQMSPRVVEMVASQQIDFGFGELPYQATSFDRPGVDTELFALSPHLLAVPVGHRLAGRAKVSAEDVAGERFISLTRSTVGRMMVDRMFEQAGVERELLIETQIAALVADFVSKGMGVGLIDPFTAHDFQGGGIVALPFEPVVEMRIAMMHPTHRPLTRIASEFIAFLRRRRREMLPDAL